MSVDPERPGEERVISKGAAVWEMEVWNCTVRTRVCSPDRKRRAWVGGVRRLGMPGEEAKRLRNRGST